jgi:hypothetical protein
MLYLCCRLRILRRFKGSKNSNYFKIKEYMIQDKTFGCLFTTREVAELHKVVSGTISYRSKVRDKMLIRKRHYVMIEDIEIDYTDKKLRDIVGQNQKFWTREGVEILKPTRQTNYKNLN